MKVFEVGDRVEYTRQGDRGTVIALKHHERGAVAEVKWDDGLHLEDYWYDHDEIRHLQVEEGPGMEALNLMSEVLASDPPMYDLLGATQQFCTLAKQIEAPAWHADPTHIERVRARKWLLSEVNEFIDADDLNDPVEWTDGLLDIIVIAWGNLLKAWPPEVVSEMAEAVGLTNLDKVLPGRLRLREGDNYVIKPDDWIGPPDIAGILAKHGLLAQSTD